MNYSQEQIDGLIGDAIAPYKAEILSLQSQLTNRDNLIETRMLESKLIESILDDEPGWQEAVAKSQQCPTMQSAIRVRTELNDRDKLICQKDEALKKAQFIYRRANGINLDEVKSMPTPFDDALSPTITSQYVKKEVADRLVSILKTCRPIVREEGSKEDVLDCAIDEVIKEYQTISIPKT